MTVPLRLRKGDYGGCQPAYFGQPEKLRLLKASAPEGFCGETVRQADGAGVCGERSRDAQMEMPL